MTSFVNINQKMHSFIHFGEVSEFRRVITPFDPPSLSKFHKWRCVKMKTTEFVRIPDSSFTFHYEIKGPDESVKLGRNTRKSVGPKGQEEIRDDGEYGKMGKSGNGDA